MTGLVAEPSEDVLQPFGGWRLVGFCLLTIPAISYFGVAKQSLVAKAVAAFSPSWIEVIGDSSLVAAVWAGVLAMHAAVSAISPVLGYSLLSAAASRQERVAPAGMVIVNAIEWKPYLSLSLLLLASSSFSLVMCPSAAGLFAALVAAVFVLAKTIQVFVRGFDLVSDEELFHKAAMKYLRAQIDAAKEPASASDSLDEQRSAFNRSIQSLPEATPEQSDPDSTLYLVGNDRWSVCAAISESAFAQLQTAFAEKSLMLCKATDGASVPQWLAKSRLALLVAVVPSEVGVADERVPGQPIRPTASDVQQLQQTLSGLIVFRVPDSTKVARKASFLVSRHLWQILLTSLEREDEREFKYGIGVLGELIGHLHQATPSQLTHSVREESREWVVEIPRALLSRIESSSKCDALYREFVAFLRTRMVGCFGRQDLRTERDSYIWMMSRLMVMGGREQASCSSITARYVREIPLLSKKINRNDMVALLKLVITGFLDPALRYLDCKPSRDAYLRTLKDLLTGWAPKSLPEMGLLRAQAMVSLRAAAMYMAASEEDYTQHLAQVEDFSKKLRHKSFGASEVLALVSDGDTLEEEWDWSGWEMRKKPEGEAHFVSISRWMDISISIELSMRVQEVAQLKGAEIPTLSALERIQRAVSSAEESLQLLPQGADQRLKALREVIGKLHSVRSEVVASAVANSGLDSEKIDEFLSGAVEDIDNAFQSFGRALSRSGALILGNRPTESLFGSSQIVPKEWFVPDSILDHSIHVIPPSQGVSLLRHEAGVILSRLVEIKGSSADGLVGLSEGDRRQIFEEVGRLKVGGSRNILVVGDDSVLFELKYSFGLKENNDTAELSAEVLFLPASAAEGSFRCVAVLPLDRPAISVTRFQVPVDRDLLKRAESSLMGGLASVSLYVPSASQIQEWVEKLQEPEREIRRKDYQTGLIYSVQWSFEVSVDPESFRVFALIDNNRFVDD